MFKLSFAIARPAAGPATNRPALPIGRVLASIFAMLALWAAPANAQKPPDVTAGEMALLPEYCVDTMGFNYGDRYYNTSPRAPYWVSLMGEGFWAVHHHCWGLIKMRRALAPGVSPPIRRGGLEGAIADFQYVIAHTAPDFRILPEVYLRMGDAFVQLQNYGAARDAYTMARQKKPDYWPACVNWAEALLKIGSKRDALKHLSECLAVTPEAPALRSAYQRLGGDLNALPRPSPPPEPASAPASAASAS